MILDREQYRYQKFISDIAGQDIRAHADDPRAAISIVRNWLRSTSPATSMPGGDAIGNRYDVFRKELPSLCSKLHISPPELTFIDYTWFVTEWLGQNPWA